MAASSLRCKIRCEGMIFHIHESIVTIHGLKIDAFFKVLNDVCLSNSCLLDQYRRSTSNSEQRKDVCVLLSRIVEYRPEKHHKEYVSLSTLRYSEAIREELLQQSLQRHYLGRASCQSPKHGKIQLVR